jgi:YD repeat-containing protein
MFTTPWAILTSKVDRKNQTIQYMYDALNRLSHKGYPDATGVDWVVGHCYHERQETYAIRRQLLLLISIIPAFANFTGCTSSGVTQLADGFKSYDKVADVRERLKQPGLGGRWQERQEGPHSDPRPTYQFLTMSGPFSLLGADGDLKLVFFNGRLMGTDFSTLHGKELIAAMREHGVGVPANARDEVTTDRRTRLRYDIGPSGVFHFSWRDAKLENEWLNWVRDNS